MYFKPNFEQFLPKKEDYEKAKKALDYIIPILEKTPHIYDVFVGGSYAKGTWLGRDIDIFVRFPKKYKGQNISIYIEQTLKEHNVPYIKLHGSRDYFQTFYEGLKIEIVPILKLDSPLEREFVTDISQFHVEWVKKNIKGLENDAKYFKIFNKLINTYGAESYLGGLSGYACEILTIHYKGFTNLLKGILKWKPKVFIDIEKHYSNIKEAINELGKDKTASPLILIDPVDKTRNVAASLSYKNFALIIANSYLYLNNNILYKINKSDFETMLEITFRVEETKEDIKNAKISRLTRKIVNYLEKNGIEVYAYTIDFDKNKSYLWVCCEKITIKTKHLGPPAWVNLDKFLEKHNKFFIREDGRLYTIINKTFSVYDIKKVYPEIESIKFLNNNPT
ncbi:NEQ152 [Nanoarchaeum equitans Kin4-M]|uniref:CCA-adding enzyme n=1 Tax=Nanoarchaeum equitans (strain Kin4-M) TaxID=228908 RepID=CCA_NANEQ|nr:RecName: Full=CCA-adding enzyme; AltName: Full=CCA tRNA nucleotidyltransferase; AltName: Full=tRNA CCA-pyrophosphorylase; AltName: Full=tRNA adenylyl-/cytidylyl- transferase; AltName: Full=tRNA nucleotidyltransferase; AltName: Full=tRNA-NT [Nanoarchaeum equitans Kin4-M]AAR39007.1 NEQ152 [Nanoarchaeum equitans Kin4-M]